jgi:HKD family nuclease
MSEPAPVARTLFAGVDGEALVFGLPANFGIVEEIKRSTSVRLATAYGKIGGWKQLEGAVLTSNASVYLLAGLDFGLTEPGLLRQWLKLRQDGRIYAKVFKRGANFHPKVLIAERHRDQGFAIVGSGNLSGGGLLNNIECSLYTEDGGVLLRLKRWFDTLFYDERASSVTPSVIKECEPFHRTVKLHAEEARRAGRRFEKEVAQLRRSRVNEIMRDARKGDSEFFYVNTDIRYEEREHKHMLGKGEACAFGDAKELIDKIPSGAVVFLYRSSKWRPWIPGQVGIVAFGKVTGKLTVRSYDGDPREAHCKRLKGFRRLDRSIKASEIRNISRQVRGEDIAFNGTSNRIDTKLGERLLDIALRRSSL